METKLTIEEIDEQIKKLQEQKETIKKENEEKLKAEKATRKAEVDEAFKNYIKLRDAFVSNYGYYVFNEKEDNHTLDFLDYLFN